MTVRGYTGAYRSAIADLAVMVDVWQRIQREHVPTGDGFCAHPSCGRPGSGRPYVPSPCSTRAAADAAAALHRLDGGR